MLADALLRSVAGTSALLRVTGLNTSTDQSEVGLRSTTFTEIVVSPVVMRKLRPTLQDGDSPKCELLVSASSVARLDQRSRPGFRAISLFHDIGCYRFRPRLSD